MITINLKQKTKGDGHLVIDVPTGLKGKDVDVVLVIQENEKVDYTTPGGKKVKKKFDFSHLYGKLEWKGDAVAEQKKIRSEWK